MKRSEDNVRHVTVRDAGWLMPLFFIPNIAVAEFRLNTKYLERDITLITVAVVTLVLFYLVRNIQSLRVRPLGRRLSDLEQFQRSLPEFRFESATPKIDPRGFWETAAITPYPVTPPQGSVLWNVSLFSATQRQHDPGFDEVLLGCYSFASSPEEAERIITPIMRKIYARYKHQFEVSSPITLLYSNCPEETLTWFSSEATMRNVLFRFLDECLVLSNLNHLEPCLTICRGTIFWIAVTWNDAKDLDFAKRLIETQRHLDLIEEEDCVGLRLHLSTPESEVRQETAALELRSA